MSNFLSQDALGNPVTFKTYDVGDNIQSSQVILSDTSGNPISSVNPLPVSTASTTQQITAQSLPLPTGAATAAKQPALGISGTPSSDVITVQGITNMVPLAVGLPTGAAIAAKQAAPGVAGTASSDVVTVQGVAGMTPVEVNGSAFTQPVSISTLPLPAGAATASKQPALGISGTPASDVLTVQGAVGMQPFVVTGSGYTQPVSWSSQSVSLTGTLPSFATVPTVNLGSLGGASTASLQSTMNSTLASILTAVQSQRAETLWTDDTGAFYVRIDSEGTVTWTNISGVISAAPGVGARPASGADTVVDKSNYQATVSATGYNVADYLDHILTVDASTGAIIGNFWINATQNTILGSSPVSSNISPLSPLPTGAATASLQTAGNSNTAQIHADLTATNTAIGTLTSTVATATLQTTTNTALATLHSDLSTTNANTGQLHTDLTSTNANLATLITDTTTLITDVLATNTAIASTNSLLTTVNTNLGTIQTNIGTTNTEVTTVNANLTTLHSDLASVNSNLVILSNDLTAPTPAGTNIIGSVLGRSANPTVTPTVTASTQYSIGMIVGGVLVFPGCVDTAGSGILQSVRVSVKSAQAAGMKLYLFNANPVNSTWTDKTAPSINGADVPFLMGVYVLSSPDFSLGAHSLYTLDGIGKSFSIQSGTTLYGILITTGTPTFLSTSDVSIYLGILKD